MRTEPDSDGGSNGAEFLAGGGEMGAHMRAHDWNRSPLGPPRLWPQALRTAVGIMLNSRHPMFCAWGPELLFLYNDGYAPIFGRKHPAALAQPFAHVWSEIWDDIRPLVDRALSGEPTWSENLKLYMARNGFLEEVYFTFSYSPVFGEGSRVDGMFCACQETTDIVVEERRARTIGALAEVAARAQGLSVAQTGESCLAALASNPDVPFALHYVLNAVGTPALAGQMGDTHGLRNGDALPLAQPVPDDTVWLHDLDAWFDPLPTSASGEPVRSAALLPVPPRIVGDPHGLLLIGLNPRRPLDDKYRVFVERTGSAMATAIANARAFEAERRRAETLAEVDRAKTAFFANVSHEFRTPLTLMLGPLQHLLEAGRTSLSESVAGQLEVVLRNGQRMLRLVNTLLEFARLEAGRVQAVYEPTDIAHETRELASNFRSLCERAGLQLLVDCPSVVAPVHVDRALWEQIVLNLLSNAFKFTFEGAIEVSVRQAGQRVELRVRDTGVGIPAADLPRVFERFHRIAAVKGRTFEGSGIGLALVQELVHLHGGDISVESTEGKGTTFCVSLPLGTDHLPPEQLAERARVPRAERESSLIHLGEAMSWLTPADDVPVRESHPPGEYPPDHPGSAPGDDRPRVLVADDNSDMRLYLSRVLSERYTVELAADGEAALALARARPPSLIVSDVMMPRVNGFELLAEVRSDPLLSGVPVILLSARAGEESRVEGMEAGADDYLIKPFSARELRARVGAHVEMARLRREGCVTLDELVQKCPFGIYIVDENARIVSVNEGSRQGVFANVTHPVGRPIDEVTRIIWPEALATEVVDLFRHTLLTGQPFRSQDFSFTRADTGRLESYEWELHRITLPDRRMAVVCYYYESTRLREAEQALKALDRRKDQFLATLAHELRNPLAPVRSALEVMRLSGEHSPPVEQARAMMERQIAQMARLIDDLMDVSRISLGKITLQKSRVSLQGVLGSAIEACSAFIDARGHVLEVDVPTQTLHVEADGVRLAQVFANLLNNAAKYTDPGGHIRAAIQCEAADAVVTVTDDGIGMPPEMLPRVFELFTQVESSIERSHGGLGIGLNLARELVRMHGGSIEARSEGLRRGSEFVVRLPLSAAEDRPLAPAPAEHPVGGGSLNVLVVDDSTDAANSMAMLIRMLGHRTCTAADGSEALRVGAEFQPNVIFMDIGMPNMSGYEAARRIAREAWGRKTVLVACTGWGQEEDKREAHEAGFHYHMVKPIDPKKLTVFLADLTQAQRGQGRPLDADQAVTPSE